MQVASGNGNELGKRATPSANPNHRPADAMLLHSPPAPVALAAADVDLGDDALADPRTIRFGSRFDDADELVAWNAAKAGVSVEELQIGPADAGHSDTDEAFAGLDRRRYILERDRAVA